MPNYKIVNITCYCGKQYPNSRVGQPVKCSCGIVLHTQQKKHGTGKVWGEASKEKTADTVRLIQAGKSKLEAQFVE